MKQWRNALVGSEVSLEKAIEVLDKAALRIALVVDDEERLLGTLTDGDVRRALLKHLPMDTPVNQVMNANPKTAEQSWTESRILALMEQYEVLQLPLVDSEKKLVGLESLHHLLNKHRHDNPVFLMAGGFGTRLRPLTNNCPKPMLKVGDKPILEQILLGFVHEEPPLGTGGALGLLPRDEIDLPMFMMNGDLLTSLNFQSFLEFHEKHEGIATMCVREYEHQVPYGVITSDGTRIESMVEKPIQRFFVNAGIYLLSPELVKSVKPGTRIDMPSLLEKQIEQGREINMFPVHEYWLDIGRMDDFNKAQNEVGQL